MLKRIAIYGSAAGVVVGAPLFGLTVWQSGHRDGPGGLVFGYLTMLVALSAVFVAIKRHRDRDLGGVIRFWPALGLGLGISLVAGVFYVVAWEAALAVAHLDFGAAYARQMVEQARTRGMAGAALAKVVAEAEAFRAQYADPLRRLPMTFMEIFPVGVLVSLVSAGLLRDRRFLAARRG